MEKETMTESVSEMFGWHFVGKNRRLRFDAQDVTVAPGYSYYYEGQTPRLFYRGLHASERAFDALQNAPMEIICRVRLVDVVERDSNKAVAWQRDVLAVADATQELRLFACWCARQVRHLLPDERYRRIVEVAEQYALGNATAENLAEARDAASDTLLSDARGAACTAACTTALDSPVEAALHAASYSARAAAWGVPVDVRGGVAKYDVWVARWVAHSVEFERRMWALVGEEEAK